VYLKHGYCMLIHFIHGYYCIYRPWQLLTYLYFPYCISLIYFSFTKIRMFLYAQIYWLAEFGDVSWLQFNYLRVETLTPDMGYSYSHFDLGGFCRTILSDNFKSDTLFKSNKTLCPTWEYDRWYTWRDLYYYSSLHMNVFYWIIYSHMTVENYWCDHW
jgi:hypothetical protein